MKIADVIVFAVMVAIFLECVVIVAKAIADEEHGQRKKGESNGEG